MPTIAEVYGPLIEAARCDEPKPDMLLRAVGAAILRANPGQCRNLADGVRAARTNLVRYAGHFDPETQSLVWRYFRLGDPLGDDQRAAAFERLSEHSKAQLRVLI
jgi:hypothetical protein